MVHAVLLLATLGAAGDCDSASPVACSLNGDCVGGKCVCDPAWSGSADCDQLSFEEVPQGAGYFNSTEASWGGNVVFSDGKYHLFAAQMALGCGLDHWGSNSAIVRAESSSPGGPFEYRETVVPAFAHNPTIRKIPGGGYALYMIGGTINPNPVDCRNGTQARRARTTDFGTGIRVSHAASVNGPWTTPKVIEMTVNSSELKGGWTNPSPHFLTNGTVGFAFQAQDGSKRNHALVGFSLGTSWEGPFTYTSPNAVTPEKWYCIAGQDEDPFMWKSPRGWHIITHGMCPAGPYQAHYKYSADGVTWYTSPRETYTYRVAFAGGKHRWFARMERPQLFFNKTHTDGSVSEPLWIYNGICGDGLIVCDEKQAGFTHTLARPLKSS